MNEGNRHYWLKSGSYSLLLNIQSLLFSFGGFYLLIRLLDKHSFGIWTLFIATTTIFEMARSGLVQNALIKYLSFSSKEDHSDILSASYFLSGVLMIVCIILNISIAGYLANLWHYPGLVPMFYLYSMVYLFQGILFQFQWIEQANLSFIGILVTSVLKQGGFFFYILVCFVFQYKTSLIALIYAQVVSTFIAMVAEYFFMRKYLSSSFKVDMVWVKKLLNFGKYVFGTSVCSTLSGTINQMMLGAILSPDAAGAFNVSTKLINLIDLPTNSIGAIVFPQSAKRFATEGNAAVKYLYEKSVGTILALSIPLLLFLFLFPDFVVHIIAGSKYAEAIPILRVMILCSLINPFMRLFGPILDSIGKPNINFIVVILFTIINLTLNYILIERLGIIGSVYATLIADIIIYAMMYVILRKEFNVNPLNTFRYAIRFYPEFVKNYLRPAIKL